MVAAAAVVPEEEDEPAMTWTGMAHPPTADAVHVQLVVVEAPALHPLDCPVVCTLTVDALTSKVQCVVQATTGQQNRRVEVALSIHHAYDQPRSMFYDFLSDGHALHFPSLATAPLRGLFSRTANQPPLGGLGRAASGVAHASVQGIADLSGRVWDAARHTAATVGHARGRSAEAQLLEEAQPTPAQVAQRDAAMQQVPVWGGGSVVHTKHSSRA